MQLDLWGLSYLRISVANQKQPSLFSNLHQGDVQFLTQNGKRKVEQVEDDCDIVRWRMSVLNNSLVNRGRTSVFCLT